MTDRLGQCDFFYCCERAASAQQLHGVALAACPAHADALAELLERAGQADVFVLVSAFIPRLSRQKRLDLLAASGRPTRALAGV